MTTAVAVTRRDDSSSPLLSGTALAIVLHGLLILMLLLELSHRKPVPPPSRLIVNIEMNPRPDSMAAAAIKAPTPPPQAAPPPSPPKPAPPKPKVMPQPLVHASPKLAPTVPPPTPPRTQPRPPTPVPAPPVQAQPSPVPSPPVQSPSNLSAPADSSAGHVERLPEQYLQEVSNEVHVFQTWPVGGHAQHMHGTATVHMHLKRDGTLLDAELVRSSGYTALDDAAVYSVTRAKKFPPLPDRFLTGQSEFAIDQPLVYIPG